MDWNPEAYGRFTDLRLRPALDLLRALGPVPDGPVVDLGCGAGAVGPALTRLNRPLTGVDSSAAMLGRAKASGVYAWLEEADIAGWRAEVPPALIFSNAALHWLPDHAALLPRLVAQLAPDGVLAVQVPHQNDAPSHRLWRTLAAERGVSLPDGPGVLTPAEYHAILAPLGAVDLWETEYLQHLAPAAEGHPVRRFTESTYGGAILDALPEHEREGVRADYDRRVAEAYPLDPDGGTLFPFRRLFFILRRTA